MAVIQRTRCANVCFENALIYSNKLRLQQARETGSIARQVVHQANDHEERSGFVAYYISPGRKFVSGWNAFADSRCLAGLISASFWCARAMSRGPGWEVHANIGRMACNSVTKRIPSTGTPLGFSFVSLSFPGVFYRFSIGAHAAGECELRMMARRIFRWYFRRIAAASVQERSFP